MAWREIDKTINESFIQHVISSINANVIITTDGSIRQGVTAWGGGVWRKESLVTLLAAAAHGVTSSFRAENEAFTDALTWMRQNRTTDDIVTVLTNSLSFASRIEA